MFHASAISNPGDAARRVHTVGQNLTRFLPCAHAPPALKLTALLSPLPHRLRRAARDPRLHEFLWFCVPGIAVAFVLRAWLMATLPWGFYHPDTHDFLTTVYFLKAHRHWEIHGKTTFLTPLCYTLAYFVPKVPALIVIPLAQHLRGLFVVLMMGAVCRLWCVYWRWLIVPLTILAAIQPAMIFWEHTLLSESGFVFGAVALALAGTVFARWPGWPGLGGLLAAMFLVAAARPEGNLWLGAGVLSVLIVYWGRWRAEAGKIAAIFAMTLLMFSITKVSHSGLLLYASLVHLTPDEPRAVPGFGPYIRPLRDRMALRRQASVTDDVVRTSKRINEALVAYARDHPDAKLGLPGDERERRRKSSPNTATEGDAELDLRIGNNLSNLCRRLAIESARAHPFALPGLAWRKFLAPINTDSGGRFEERNIHDKQAFSLSAKPDVARVITPGLLGTRIDSYEQARAFVESHYHLDNVRWFNALEAGWQAAVDFFHFPPSRYSDTFELPGPLLYHFLACLGALASLFRPGPARRFQWAFVPTLFGAWFIVTLTAAVIPRHRFVMELFWLLYLFFLLDGIGWLVVGLSHRSVRRPSSPDQTLANLST